MILRSVALAFVLSLAFAVPAVAWDPFAGNDDDTPTQSPDPAPYIAPGPAPMSEVTPPPGVYYVTDTYVGNVVATSGLVTMYTTATVHQSTGSYARVLEVVGTGMASQYDGRSFNGRGRLGDGRLVAGTYYENYVATATGFEAVSIVFFQDDAEIARLAAQAPASPAPTTSTARARTIGSSPAIPIRCCGVGDPPVGASPAPTGRPIRPVISFLPVSAPLAHIEVLRGRAVALWLRAFVGEREVSVRQWTLLSGDAGDAVALSGDGATPFRTAWTKLAPPGSAYELRFLIEAETESGRQATTTGMSVLVRAPALTE
jgi:hypothetical protein